MIYQIRARSALKAQSTFSSRCECCFHLIRLKTRLPLIILCSQTLKGMVLLEGCSVTEAEFAIKFPKWHKGQVYRTQIRSNAPWPLSQVLNLFDLTYHTLTKRDSKIMDILEHIFDIASKNRNCLLCNSIDF